MNPIKFTNGFELAPFDSGEGPPQSLGPFEESIDMTPAELHEINWKAQAERPSMTHSPVPRIRIECPHCDMMTDKPDWPYDASFDCSCCGKKIKKTEAIFPPGDSAFVKDQE